MTEAPEYIPLIDLSGFLHGSEEERVRVGTELGYACERSGFFIVKGHGIDPEIIERAWNSVHEFFDLPEEEKLKYMTQDEEKYPFGYSGMGMEILSAGKDAEHGVENKAAPDLKELFSLGPANPDAGFPARQFPSMPATFERDTSRYYDALANLADTILAALTIPLGLERDYFKQFLTHHASALRALNYPELPPGYQHLPGQMRASAHTDYGTITILRSGGPGLQVCKDVNPLSWVDAPTFPNDDIFYVNLGDLMRRWTNDKYASTLHRVLPSTDRRQSIAFFHNLNRDAVVSNLLKSQGEANKYEDIKAGDFLMQKHLASLAQSPTVCK